MQVLKHMTLLSVCMFCQLSLAGSMGGTTTSPMNGFYLGGDIGLANLLNKESHAVLPETHQLGTLGIAGGGLLGYEQLFTSTLRLGLEIFADATGLNMAIDHTNASYKMNQRYDLGVRVLPAYAFTPDTAGHLLLGYVNGKFNILDNGVYGNVNNGFHQNGFQGGLGVSNLLASNLFVRLDALYDVYAANTTLGTGLAANPTQSYTNSFSGFMGELSLVYKFL